MADETIVTADTSNGAGEDADLNVEPTVDTLPRKEDGSIDEEAIVERNKKLYARTKKAEADAKAAKNQTVPAPKPEAPATPQAPNVEEVVLKAQGMAPELLSQLKDIAALRGVSLLDAQSDPLFVAVKSEFEKAEKSKAAAVGVSRGSGSQKAKPSLATPALSREDHKALFRERLSS